MSKLLSLTFTVTSENPSLQVAVVHQKPLLHEALKWEDGEFKSSTGN